MTTISRRRALKAALLSEMAHLAYDGGAAEHMWILAEELGMTEAQAERMIQSVSDEVGNELAARVARLGGVS